MKLLLMKEIRLSASPLTWWFLAFAAITMIPNYPILLSAFFVCLGIFYTFQSGREQNDTLYTALLPVEKRDVVRAKYGFTILIELIALALIVLFTALRMTVLKEAAIYAENPLMRANPAYIGYALVIFGLFNTVFLPGFFRTAYYIGKPFIAFCAASFLVIAIGETLHHIPGLEALNAPGAEPVQWLVLTAGIVFYVLAAALGAAGSERRFEKIDL